MKSLKLNFLFTLIIGLFITGCQDELVETDSIEKETVTFHSHDERCGHTAYMEQIMSDPVKKQEHEEKLNRFNAYKLNVGSRAACSNPVILPVAVHFQNTSGANITCLRTLAQSQIERLNKDYQGTNGDLTKFTNAKQTYFPNVNFGEACIGFELATKNHPSGYGLSDGDLAVTVNKTNGDSDSNWSGYINIFVQPNTGLLGYAPLGGSGNGDGVVIDANAFGSGAGCGSISPNAPFNLGRTLVHEMGHYLLLDHIWGAGCGSDDGVSDTPNASSEHYGCPNFGIKSCSTNDLFVNYMDYVDDGCMVMFSAGQATRMENYVNSNLGNVVSNAANVLGSGSTGGGNTGGGGGGTTTSCENVDDLKLTLLSNTSAKFSWTAQSGATKYRVRYKKIGTSTWNIKTTSGLAFTVSGLLQNTNYKYQIRTKCPTGWTPYGPQATFTTGGSTGGGGGTGCQKTTAKIEIKLDYYGSETTWELVDDYGDVIESGGPYSNNQVGSIKSKTLCLDDGCYTLYIDDAYGDGICCSYGNGNAKIKDANGTVIGSSDGNFGYYDYIDFCADAGSLSFTGQKTDAKASNIIPKEMPSN